METPLKVYTASPWWDHSSSQGLVWTVTDGWYTLVNVVIGVSVGLVQPCIERILAHLLAWLCYATDRSLNKPTLSNQAGRSQGSEEHEPLLHSHSHKSREICLVPSWTGCWSRSTVTTILSGVLVLFTILYAVAGSFVTTIPSDNAALSGSNTCGLWGLKDNANPAAQDSDALIQGERETRAGQYARNCYGPQSANSLNSCMLFKQPSIVTSKIETGQQCPFVNETYCPGTGFTAVKMTTGLVDATRIGVNAAKSPKINRTTICVPINMHPGFAEKTENLPGYWGFRLGRVSSEEYSSNYTFQQYGDPFKYDVRSYTMSTYKHVYSKSDSQNYWKPISSLGIQPQLNIKSQPYSLTVMFINSCRIFYKEDSNDPIFPADSRWPRDPELWINNDSRARPLACIDWIEVCNDREICGASHHESEDRDGNYVFTRYALNKSTIFDAVEFGGAMGLDAQYKIKDDTSLPLNGNPPQWIVESWSLFNSSLARIQYDALDIANGTGSDKEPLYVSKTPVWLRGRLCHIFTFQVPKGYKNVRIWPTIGKLCIPLAFLLLGVKSNKEFSEKIQQTGYFNDLKPIGLELAAWNIKGLYDNIRDRLRRPAELDVQDRNTAIQSESSNPQSGSTMQYDAVNHSNLPRPPTGLEIQQPASELPATNIETQRSISLHSA